MSIRLHHAYPGPQNPPKDRLRGKGVGMQIVLLHDNVQLKIMFLQVQKMNTFRVEGLAKTWPLVLLYMSRQPQMQSFVDPRSWQ